MQSFKIVALLLLGYFWLVEEECVDNSAHADGGPRSRVCARETLRSDPHRHERKFSGTRVCRVALKHLPQPLRSHIQSFRTLRQVFLGNI